MQGQGLPGFRDFYPAEAALRNRIFGVWRDVAARYGFEEYDGPPLEPLELYLEKSGDEIAAQLYEFEDKGGRRVALRPEMTPTLARMVAARAAALKKPIRWFSIPQLFRYERQQRGRLREHFQLNMDLIGESGPLADAEVAAASLDIVRAFGFGPADVRIRMSDRRVIRALLARAGVAEAQLPHAYAAMDKVEREPSGVLADRLTAAGVARPAADAILRIGQVRGRPGLLEALADVRGGEESAEGLLGCVDALDAMGLGAFVDVDLSIVRGLAYYTGVVFELFDAGRSLRAICGGGRYDALLQALGGVDLPAVGFGMGDVVLGELVSQRAPVSRMGPALDLFLVAVGSEDVPHVLALAHRLRDAGRRVEFALRTSGLGKQLKLAAAREAPRAAIVGPNERASGVVVVRDLANGAETRVAAERLEDILTHA
jgi:histidyl-tRNA synthetase